MTVGFHREEERPFVYGHRGTRIGMPENTLGGLCAAIEQGADGVELDVRLSGDGQIVVIHDLDDNEDTN